MSKFLAPPSLQKPVNPPSPAGPVFAKRECRIESWVGKRDRTGAADRAGWVLVRRHKGGHLNGEPAQIHLLWQEGKENFPLLETDFHWINEEPINR